MKLNALAFGVAIAIWWGGSVLLLTWWLMALGVSGQGSVLFDIYPGHDLSFAGSLIGLVWGLVDGFIGGWLLAWLYNFIAAKLPAKETAQA